MNQGSVWLTKVDTKSALVAIFMAALTAGVWVWQFSYGQVVADTNQLAQISQSVVDTYRQVDVTVITTPTKISDPNSFVSAVPVATNATLPPQIIAVLDSQNSNHIVTPQSVKAIYMTSWVAGTKNIRQRILDIIDDHEFNAVVIDIKDDTGRVAFDINNAYIDQLGSDSNRISDIENLINILHDQGVYVIGRLSAFQDPYIAIVRPEWAVRRKSTGDIWKDNRGLAWIDAGATEMHDYLFTIAKESHRLGFDEINFDYVRFPSDGNLKDAVYPYSEGKSRSAVIKTFFEAVHDEFSDTDIVVSADLFGLTAINNDDLGIGQILEDALVNFDYVAPMVYPSHYADGFQGLSNPANYPYEVIYASMSSAIAKAEAVGVDPLKLRPWLQDFDMGAIYDAQKVRAQIQAVYDVGLNSWMMWDPSNRYTLPAYQLKDM